MSRYRSMILDLVMGVLATALGYAVPALALVLVFPGIVAAFGIQLLARALGAGPGAFDGDEVPGPVAMGIGLVVNVIAWALVTRGVRWFFRRDA